MLDKELEISLLPQRIAVTSSATAAGCGDSCHQLQHSFCGFYSSTELFPALMQGSQVEEFVLTALDAVDARMKEFDVVVIIRRGGIAPDLSGLDTYPLAAACAQLPLPVIAGTGYRRDDTVLDSVVHTRAKAPTTAAELLINRMGEAADRLKELAGELHARIYHRPKQERKRLSLLRSCIPSRVMRKPSESRIKLQIAKSNLPHATETLLVRQHHRLELLQSCITDASSQRLLKRGYSVTLKERKAVENTVCLRPGDKLTTRLHEGEMKSKVESIPS